LSRTLLSGTESDRNSNRRSTNVNRGKLSFIFTLAALLLLSATPSHAQATNVPAGNEANYAIHDFHFKSGESLFELKIHYVTFGKPERDKDGRVTNAALILHGTSGSSRSLLNPVFAGVLFAPGGLLDITRY
jgi:homoserine O-acetyltransferase